MPFSRLQSQVLSGTGSTYIHERRQISTHAEIRDFHYWITVLCTQTCGPCPPDPTRNGSTASVIAGLPRWAGRISRFGIDSFCCVTPPSLQPFRYVQEDILSQHSFPPLELSVTHQRADPFSDWGLSALIFMDTAQTFCQQVGWTDLLGVSIRGCIPLYERG